MTNALRIDPRRPESLSASGLNRIVLSKSTAADAALVTKPLRTTVPPQQWMMAVAHAERGVLTDHARQSITAAALLAGPRTGVLAVILGALVDDLSLYGADLIAVISECDVSRFDPDREVAIVSAFIEHFAPVHILMPDSAMGDADLGRRLIASLNTTAATHVAELNRSTVAVRWDGGARLARRALPRVVLLEADVVTTDLPFVGAGIALPGSDWPLAETVQPNCRDLGLESSAVAAVALEDADFVVSGGHGVQNTETLEHLATALGAAVGASRVAVDEGKFPRERQIGASGKTIRANAYVAVGISGAVQHLQGIKDCRHVIAINSDPAAPITKRANLTITGDAEDVMQAVITRVQQARAQRDPQEDH
jgi:electron transfer flavoprotein alpha subunit